jgi:hypothetical protein
MCYCDAEPAKVWDANYVTARKPWTCVECRRPIAKGERHERVGALHDGSWSTYRTCLGCVDIRRAFFAADDEGGCFEVGELFAGLVECPEAAAKMPPAVLGRAMGLLYARHERWADEQERRRREVAA